MAEEAKKEADIRHTIKLICKKLVKGKTLDEIADDIEENADVIRPLYETAVYFSPEYDEEKVYEAYLKDCVS